MRNAHVSVGHITFFQDENTAKHWILYGPTDNNPNSLIKFMDWGLYIISWEDSRLTIYKKAHEILAYGSSTWKQVSEACVCDMMLPPHSVNRIVLDELRYVTSNDIEERLKNNNLKPSPSVPVRPVTQI